MVGNYTTILVDYNKIVSLYLTTTNNVLTRQKIYSTLMETKPLYLQLGNLTLRILYNYDQIPDPRIRGRTIIKYFVKVLLLLSLYDIINKQLDGNQSQRIPESSILTHRNSFAPDWVKSVIREFNLKIELYGIPTPPPPPTGKAPGGGLGWFPPGGGPPSPPGGDPPYTPGPPPDPPRTPPRTTTWSLTVTKSTLLVRMGSFRPILKPRLRRPLKKRTARRRWDTCWF